MPEDCDFDINGDEIKKEVKQGDIKEGDIKKEVDDEDAIESNFEAKPNKLNMDKNLLNFKHIHDKTCPVVTSQCTTSSAFDVYS